MRARMKNAVIYIHGKGPLIAPASTLVLLWSKRGCLNHHEIKNRSVQLVARNREYLKELNNVPHVG